MSDPRPRTVEYSWFNPRVPAAVVVVVFIGGAIAIAAAAWANYHRLAPEQRKRLAERDAAVEQLRDLGATFEYRTFKESEQIWVIDLAERRVKDDDLVLLKAVGFAELRLDHTQITDQGLKHIKERGVVGTLDLRHTSISEAGLEQLKGEEHLSRLELYGTSVTKEGVNRLRQALPDCEIIY